MAGGKAAAKAARRDRGVVVIKGDLLADRPAA